MASATDASVSASATSLRPAYQAYQILHVGYVVLPLIAGFDKFFDRLVNWDVYLARFVTRVTGLDRLVNWDVYLAPVVTRDRGRAGHTFMTIVGVIEIVAGLLVAFWPQVGGYVVTLWFWGTIANLLLEDGTAC